VLLFGLRAAAPRRRAWAPRLPEPPFPAEVGVARNGVSLDTHRYVAVADHAHVSVAPTGPNVT